MVNKPVNHVNTNGKRLEVRLKLIRQPNLQVPLERTIYLEEEPNWESGRNGFRWAVRAEDDRGVRSEQPTELQEAGRAFEVSRRVRIGFYSDSNPNSNWIEYRP